MTSRPVPAPSFGCMCARRPADPQIGFVLTKPGVTRAAVLCTGAVAENGATMSGGLPWWWPMRTIPGKLGYLDFFSGLPPLGRRRRTPAPPPFSSMNSTPAVCKASRILSPVSLRPPSWPSPASNRLIVGIDTLAAPASSSCDQPNRARAAFTCRIDTFSIDNFAMR